LINNDQFGGLKGTSTTLALIDLLHYISNESDSSDKYVRMVMLDFRKAFDMIHHSTLLRKLQAMDVPLFIREWIASFLTGREQCVRIGKYKSMWRTVKGGVPQGTKLGPLLFIIYINDLAPACKVVKYIDDTTLVSCNDTDSSSEDPMQVYLNEVDSWCTSNHMSLNALKSFDMVFHFDEKTLQLRPLRIRGNPIDSVDQATLLGLTISTSLKWDAYISSVTQKASRRLYLLIQLKRSGCKIAHLRQVYLTMVRPILEYAAPVWHSGINAEQTDNLERIQRRALRLIFPQDSSDERLRKLKTTSLSDRRHNLCKKLYNEMKDPSHKLNHLLPANRNITYNLRKKRQFSPLPFGSCRKDNTFINWSLIKLQ